MHFGVMGQNGFEGSNFVTELPMLEDCMMEMKAKDKNLVHGLLTTKHLDWGK